MSDEPTKPEQKKNIKPQNTTPKTNVRMKLWNQVCETNPAITKHVAQRGGFTAICAQAQIKQATEIWGPYGTDWGVRSCQYRECHDSSGKLVEVSLDAEFYYPGGMFEIGTDIAFRAGGDTRKKLLTDLTTKALSKLGFNSDIFEGKFDDDRYVADLNEKYGKVDTPAKKVLDDTELPKPNKQQQAVLDAVVEGLAQHNDDASLIVSDKLVAKKLLALKQGKYPSDTSKVSDIIGYLARDIATLTVWPEAA